MSHFFAVPSCLMLYFCNKITELPWSRQSNNYLAKYRCTQLRTVKKHDTDSINFSFDLLLKYLQIATTMTTRTEGGLPVLWDAPLVRKLDSAIHRKNHYPVDKCKGTQMRYPLFEQLGPHWKWSEKINSMHVYLDPYKATKTYTLSCLRFSWRGLSRCLQHLKPPFSGRSRKLHLYISERNRNGVSF